MSNTSLRSVQVQFSGNVGQDIIQAALENEASPAMVVITSLETGPNTINVPVVDGIVVTGLTILMPSANTVLVTLKGDDADIGIPLSLTDPTSIGLDSTFVSLVLDAADTLAGVQLIWS